MTNKKQSKPNFTYLYTYIPIYLHPVNPVNPVKSNNSSYHSAPSVAKNMIFQNEPNSAFLNPCIPALEYSCFPPNKANLSKAGSWPLEAFQLNEPNSTYLYPVHPVNPVKNVILQNKANFSIFDLKKRGSAKNKPNFVVAQASVLESNPVSAPGGFHTFSFSPLPFYFSTKRTHLLSINLLSHIGIAFALICDTVNLKIKLLMNGLIL